MSQQPLIIYHAPCSDGFTAAWIAHKVYPNAEFVPAKYGDPVPDVRGRNVFILDFSFKRSVLLEMLFVAESITILDHHKTAEADLEGLTHPKLTVVFDMNRSGAMIAWNHFFPNEPSAMVKHVQDRDLWKFEMEGTREIQSTMFSYDYTFENWERLSQTPIPELITEGRSIERAHNKDVRELIKHTERRMNIGGYFVPVCNVPYQFASDVGNALAEKADFGATYFDSPEGRKFSLRSIGDFDVSRIASLYGGGGHKNAAGFTRPIGWEGDLMELVGEVCTRGIHTGPCNGYPGPNCQIYAVPG